MAATATGSSANGGRNSDIRFARTLGSNIAAIGMMIPPISTPSSSTARGYFSKTA